MISVELINILIFLLPGFLAAAIFYRLTAFSDETSGILGFLAAAIFYWLTAHTKPGTFGQVVQALIFTFIAHILFSIFSTEQIKLPEEPSLELNRSIIWLILIAVCLGLLFAWISNKDLTHKLFRYMRITKENSYPSEWYSAFSRHPSRFVVLYCTWLETAAFTAGLRSGPANRGKDISELKRQSGCKMSNWIPLKYKVHC